MDDFVAKMVNCSSARELIATTNAVIKQLPIDVRKRLKRVISAYLAKHGVEGAFERLNGRSVATILYEFVEADAPRPIKSGTIDGVKYALFDPPVQKDDKSN